MTNPSDLLTPRILVVDDEKQIHAALRLRLGRIYDLTFCFGAKDALKRIQTERFDLCFADIHMPDMDGLAFVERAQEDDPDLGFVILSAFDTDANLRRAIPLRVYQFIPKPLPDRGGFEARVPAWVDETRAQRRAAALARQADALAKDLDSARLERDVELVASETARDALLQLAGLQTTFQALVSTATSTLMARPRTEAALSHLLRILQEARKAADASATIADEFFGSAYANRDTSPAIVNACLPHAITIAARAARAESANKVVDFVGMDDRICVQGVSGIDFLLMLIPAVGAALLRTNPNTTVAVRGEHVARMDSMLKDFRFRHCLWINRRAGAATRPAVILTIIARGPAITADDVAAWMRGEYKPFASVTPHALVSRLQQCHGIAGISAAPEAENFMLVLGLPT